MLLIASYLVLYCFWCWCCGTWEWRKNCFVFSMPWWCKWWHGWCCWWWWWWGIPLFFRPFIFRIVTIILLRLIIYERNLERVGLFQPHSKLLFLPKKFWKNFILKKKILLPKNHLYFNFNQKIKYIETNCEKEQHSKKKFG